MAFESYIEKYDPKKVRPALQRALTSTEGDYLTNLKAQLLMGKGSDGEDLKPGYLEDPYFKTRQAAMNYAVWKQKTTPSFGRNLNAPNLFITGYYHNQFKIFVYPDAVYIFNLAPFGEEVNNKYSGKATVLGGPWRKEYIFEKVLPEFKNELNLVL